MGSCYAKDVLDESAKWVGYHEEGDNWTIFADVLDKIHYFNGNKQNVAWCLTYPCYCVVKACIPEDRSDEEKKWDALYFLYQPTKDNCACGARYAADYFRQNDAWYPVEEAQPGDFIFFGPRGEETHGGLVRYVEDGRVYTREGNVDDEVQDRDYSLNYKRISGVGRPRYDGYEYPHEDTTPDPEPEPTPTPEPTPEPQPTPEPEKPIGRFEVINVSSWLNVRSGPGKEYEVIWKVYNGDKLNIYEIKNGWGRIDEYGWVSMDYLTKV